jgi:CBS domain-containing protein
MSIEANVMQATHEILEQLSVLRDESRLKLHLLSLDAQQRWSDLENAVNALEDRANREGENAAESIKDAARNLTRALKELMLEQTPKATGLLTEVRYLMTTHVRTCSRDDSLARAAQLMWDADCGALPVSSDTGIEGIITDRDVCMATYMQDKSPSQLTVGSTMSKELFSCKPDDSLRAALTTMCENRVRRLPVLDAEKRLLGIIAIGDVARWARSAREPAVDAALADTLGAISAPPLQRRHAAAE